MKLSDVARLVGGEVVGDAGVQVTGASSLEDSKEGDITFFRGNNNLKDAVHTRASAIIASREYEEIKKPLVKVSDPYLAFIRLLEHFYVKSHEPTGVSEKAFVSKTAILGSGISVHPFAHVSDGASIGDGVMIFPGVYIGEGSSIGEGSVLHPNVVVEHGVKVGKRVTIHANSVIGADGYGYHKHKGRHLKVPQVGGVIIGDDVEIGAGAAIDRATTGNTVIGAGSKIDNLVQVGHNVTVGEGSLIISQVGIGGSTRIGKKVVLGGQVGVADHVSIADGTVVAASSGVISDLEKGVYLGWFVMPRRQALRCAAIYRNLPEMNKKIEELTKALVKLKKEAGQ